MSIIKVTIVDQETIVQLKVKSNSDCKLLRIYVADFIVSNVLRNISIKQNKHGNSRSQSLKIQ